MHTRWRVIDIIVASIIGVAAGIIFWAWGAAWIPLSGAFAVTPGWEGLLAGGWLFAGVLGGLIIRKPGAALYTEIIAAVVSMFIGTQWGFATLIWGIIQGLGAEAVFAVFRYRVWNIGVAMLAGAGAGIAVGVLDTVFGNYAAASFSFKTVYFFSATVSGALVAGVLSWFAMKALATTGALHRFESGRLVRTVEADIEPDSTRSNDRAT